MPKTTVRDFLDNSKVIVGFLSTIIGFCCAANAMYELATNKKIYPITDKANIPSIVKSAIHSFDGMDFRDKSGIACPLLVIGSFLAKPKKRSPS